MQAAKKNYTSKMNALHLYRLTAVPDSNQAVAPRPVKRAKVPEKIAQTTEYTCIDCNKVTRLSSVEAIYCPSCSCRIVRKVFDKSHVTRVYPAV